MGRRYHFWVKDLIHTPESHEDGYRCERCRLPISFEVMALAAGDDICDIGGTGELLIPADGTKGVTRCSTKMVERSREEAELIRNDIGLVRDHKSLKPQSKTTDMEKMVARQSWQNFLQIRELTRPENSE